MKLDEILDRMKCTDYEGADLNALRNDVVDAIEALHTELAPRPPRPARPPLCEMEDCEERAVADSSLCDEHQPGTKV